MFLPSYFCMIGIGTVRLTPDHGYLIRPREATNRVPRFEPGVTPRRIFSKFGRHLFNRQARMVMRYQVFHLKVESRGHSHVVKQRFKWLIQ